MKSDLIAIYDAIMGRSKPHKSKSEALLAQSNAKEEAEFIIHEAIRLERLMPKIAKSMSFRSALVVSGQGVSSQKEYDTLYSAIKRLYHEGEFGRHHTLVRRAEEGAEDTLSYLNSKSGSQIKKKSATELMKDLSKIYRNKRQFDELGAAGAEEHLYVFDFPVCTSNQSILDARPILSSIERDALMHRKAPKSLRVIAVSQKSLKVATSPETWNEAVAHLKRFMDLEKDYNFKGNVIVGINHLFASEGHVIAGLRCNMSHDEPPKEEGLFLVAPNMPASGILREKANTVAPSVYHTLPYVSEASHKTVPIHEALAAEIIEQASVYADEKRALVVSCQDGKQILSFQCDFGFLSNVLVFLRENSEGLSGMYMSFPKPGKSQALMIHNKKTYLDGSFCMVMGIMNYQHSSASFYADSNNFISGKQDLHLLEGACLLDTGELVDVKTGKRVLYDDSELGQGMDRQHKSEKAAARLFEAFGNSKAMPGPALLCLNNTVFMSASGKQGKACLIALCRAPHGFYSFKKSLSGVHVLLEGKPPKNNTFSELPSSGRLAYLITAEALSEIKQALKALRKELSAYAVLVDDGRSLFLFYTEIEAGGKLKGNKCIRIADSSKQFAVAVLEYETKEELLAMVSVIEGLEGSISIAISAEKYFNSFSIRCSGVYACIEKESVSKMNISTWSNSVMREGFEQYVSSKVQKTTVKKLKTHDFLDVTYFEHEGIRLMHILNSVT